MRGDLALRDIDEDLVYLKDLIKVLLVAVAPFEDFVFVAGEFEALFA